MTIQRKILLLVIGTGIIYFLILGALSFMGMLQAENDAIEKGNEMGVTVGKFSEDYAVRATNEQLFSRAQETALRMEQKFNFVLDDAKNIAKMAEKFLNNRESYLPKYLDEPTDPYLFAHKAYIYYNPGVRERLAAEPALQERFALLSNIRDTIEFLSNFYPSGSVCYLAAEDGCFIRADGLSAGQEMAVCDQPTLERRYDFKARPWYIKGKQAGKPVVSDLYGSTNGSSEISCVAPYYENGNFAGVAGITITLDALHEFVHNREADDKDINFVLDKEGQVIMSSQRNGMLSVSNKPLDLRQTAEADLAQAAVEMTAGKSGTALVTVDGEKFYLAYVPIPSMGWSFGTLTEQEAVVAPVRDIKATVDQSSAEFAAAMSKLFRQNILRMGALLLVIFGLLVLLSSKAAQKFVQPILALTEGVREIAKGNLDKHIEVRTGDEIEELADTVNSMSRDLKTYIENLARSAAEKERLAASMALAERDRFVNKLLKYSMSGENPDKVLKQMMEYLGHELEAERTYIFEELRDHHFANTYEWCDEDITSEIDNLQHLPYEGVVDVWYEEYQKSGCVIIYDLEEYRCISEGMYQVLKPQGIHSLVTAPLAIDGKYIGFFGVDNPPPEKIKAIAETLKLMAYFISTIVRQKQHLAQEAERIEKELDGARKIQASMLPNIFPAYPERGEIDLYAAMYPAREVGGDFYDFYLLDNRHLAVTIADVSGKGIPASLFMVISKTILKNEALVAMGEAAGAETDWSLVMERANRKLCENNDELMFVTVFFGVLDMDTGEFIYVNGGHNPPLWCHDGKFAYLRMEKKSNMLGVIEEERYHAYRLTLVPGDKIFLYTDGVTEAMDASGAMYSEGRLLERLNACCESSVQKILAGVKADVSSFAGDAEQSDDITMLALAYRGRA